MSLLWAVQRAPENMVSSRVSVWVVLLIFVVAAVVFAYIWRATMDDEPSDPPPSAPPPIDPHARRVQPPKRLR